MKSLESLIKIHKNKIEQIMLLQKTLELEIQTEETIIKEREMKLSQETKEFMTNMDFLFVLHNYRNKIQELQNLSRDKITSIQKKLIDLQANLRIEFAAYKKYEHILHNKEKEMQIVLNKKEESSIMDFILMRHNK